MQWCALSSYRSIRFAQDPKSLEKWVLVNYFFTESDQMSGQHGQIRGEAMSVEDFRIEKHKRGRSFRASQIEMTVQWVDNNPQMLEQALANVAETYAHNVRQGRIDQAEADARIARVSAAADYAAIRNVDLVIEAGLQAYDVQAPIAVIEAAGGIVTDWQGRPAPQGGQILAAANREIHAEALALLNAHAAKQDEARRLFDAERLLGPHLLAGFVEHLGAAAHPAGTDQLLRLLHRRLFRYL